MYYIIYKITNNINQKHYIGKHQTKDLEDNYFGSGKNIKRAIQKYGIENFSKEILHIFKTEEEMNAKEKELVTEEFCIREDTYNICEGGKGGFSYINRTRDHKAHNTKISHKRTAETFLKISKALKGRKNFWNAGKVWYDWTGKKHSDYTKQKMSLTRKERLLGIGEKNSQFGTIWITNGQVCTKIKKDAKMPIGFYKGRNYTLPFKSKLFN